MGIFGKGVSAVMDVIRCDEQEYLVWKWKPQCQKQRDSKRENGIRYGSSLRVKEGEVAVFVYTNDNGDAQDFIIGPHDDIIRTSNFPVLSSIVGLGFGGDTPFQAEVYFINLAGNVQIKFGVSYFDVTDPRFMDFAVPVSAGGTITFNITEYKSFIKLNRLINFDLEQFKNQIKDMVAKRVKSVITNITRQSATPLVQIETKLSDINNQVSEILRMDFNDFGVNLKRFDLSRVEVDKDSNGWKQLQYVTVEQQSKTIGAQTEISIKNLADTQEINARNLDETLRIQREQAEMAQRLQTESSFLGAHALDQQTSVLKAGAQSLGSMGSVAGDGNGMNPVGLMTGMMIGGAMGGQIGNMMNQVGNAMNVQYTNPAGIPPNIPQTIYYFVIGGQQSGPYNLEQIHQLILQGQITKDNLAWKQGMSGWEATGNIPELILLFQSNTPPPVPNNIPPIPNR